jgi:hypothetical protein
MGLVRGLVERPYDKDNKLSSSYILIHAIIISINILIINIYIIGSTYNSISWGQNI